jgi:hypothetical protein
MRNAEELIDRYTDFHKRIKSVRERIPDDASLINYLTGADFGKSEQGFFQVKSGPLSIDITTDKSHAVIIYELSSWGATAEDFNKQKVGGFRARSKSKEPVDYTVVVNEFGADRQKDILTHEHGHLTNKLYSSSERHNIPRKVSSVLYHGVLGFLRRIIFARIMGLEDLDLSSAYSYPERYSQEEREFLLREYLNFLRLRALDFVKDEILAGLRLRNGLCILRENLDDLFLSDKPGYDYLDCFKPFTDPSFERDSYVRDSYGKMIEEYKTNIRDAVMAYGNLVSVGGYSIEKAIAILRDKKLTEWSKTVKRQLETRQ